MFEGLTFCFVVFTLCHALLQPLVDTCGVKVNGVYQCPSGSTASGAATIMSYCHVCGGGSAAVGMTFGGSWDEDDRNNIDNWQNDTTIDASFHTDPKRVPQASPSQVPPDIHRLYLAQLCLNGSFLFRRVCGSLYLAEPVPVPTPLYLKSNVHLTVTVLTATAAQLTRAIPAQISAPIQ